MSKNELKKKVSTSNVTTVDEMYDDDCVRNT